MNNFRLKLSKSYLIPVVLQLGGLVAPFFVDASTCEEAKSLEILEIFSSQTSADQRAAIQIRTHAIEDEEFTQSLASKIEVYAKKYPSRLLEKMNLELMITNWSANELGALKRGRLQLNEIKLRDFEKKNPGYIELVFHHEISHLIFIEFAESSRKPNAIKAYDTWRDIHRRSIRSYQDDHQIPVELHPLDASTAKPASGVSEESLRRGFLTDYGMKNLHEDFAVYAEALFTGRLRNGESFWAAYERYPAIQQKLELVIAVYREADPAFNFDYFNALRN